MTYEQIKNNAEVKALIKRGDDNLGILGFTDHSEAHCAVVAEHAAMILKEFGYAEHEQELAKIAGFMHDIGNAVNRSRHAEFGAILANDILRDIDMAIEDRMLVMSAIGNHDESTGGPLNPISAALIIADKTDVRRNRVRNQDLATFDKHDRVNYAVTAAKLQIDIEKKVIMLDLQIDEQMSTMYDYFEIFLERMLMCRRSAEMLGAKFKLTANGSKVL